MIHDARVQPLRPGEAGRRGFVLLWVQASVRVRDNHALEYAVQEASRLDLPLVAVFGLTPAYPEANARHYLYLLEGLRDLRQGLAERGIPLRVALGTPPEVALQAAQEGAALVVTDVGYVRVAREWRAWLAGRLTVPLVQVESEAVVPVRVASPKLEVGARTLRPKLHRLWHEYLVPLEPRELRRTTTDWALGLDLHSPAAQVSALPVDHSVPPGAEEGGEHAALELLEDFVTRKLETYHLRRSDPTVDGSSRLSAALHYGHLSPLTAALAAREHPGPGTDTFLEELIVRRELSFNLCTYNPAYDRYEGLPAWARATLEEHAGDPREALYTREELDAAQTHDPYWNAAQRQMTRTGRMHNYMRMYWGKKVLEWTPTPQAAYETLVWLNNRYEQDGRNPNSWAGLDWVFGQHDRPWARRPVFGMVRSMTAAGLRRKFDADLYARQWA
ncbi:deoxyribodipyrimidine photo-lyase [Deinococcus multiflagellatus]|uniref:Deoxyribodipyrimidine photo-lyase n=1 Tax=Deinococcus multiflagellatus TaxID=1656887 RepID=A0ABW1ZKX2_9DEIO|nr:deoxyribodipyrimidine photo-lyase [Deinococcus multiflagellatus]MBZ9715748.1 deoxyribodipyrimidine photo-lyase [Deinococcus multiflagellatus]